MPDEKRPFRLEDDDDERRDRSGPAPRPPRAPVPPPPRPVGEPPELTLDETPEAPPRVVASGALSDVDERTVAERLGQEVERIAGARPPPPGWPLEALSFPLRAPGPAQIAGGTAAFVLLDALGQWNVFAGYVPRLALYVFFLAWQLHVARRSASGHDRPGRWIDAIDLSTSALREVGWFTVWLVLATVATLLVFHFASVVAGVLLVAGAALYLATWALASVVGDLRVRRIDVAVGWMLARPLALLVGAAGWVVAAVIERSLVSGLALDLGVALLVSAAARAAMVYVWLVSARALGVVGRAWSP